MWKFAELTYTRPDIQTARSEYSEHTAQMAKAQTYAEAKAAFLAQDALTAKLETSITIASIRNTMDTTDPFYEEEMRFLNRAIAEFVPLQSQALDVLIQTPFRADFVAEYGNELFIKAELYKKTQSDAIVGDLIAESELCESYKKIAASCQVEFLGETCNFYGLLKHMESADRSVRKEAFAAWASLYEQIAASLDDIFDQLVKIRIRMAETLGFESYTALAYAKMGRSDYDANDVASFRKQILDVVVPAVARYREEQARRIGVDKLRYYDESFMYPEGNADPVGGEDVLIPIATDMYHALSPQTGEFFDYMVQHGLFDLQTRPGKHLGGYCTALAELKAPFIFSNFNGTAADVGVLTHETGHAFAFYSATRSQPIGNYTSTTSEVAEIHSMSMEHFTYPWLGELFGNENAAKAKYAHLMEAVYALPYLVSVDAFQHRIYDPDITAAERRAIWHDIEKTYMPWRDYDANSFLGGGGFWMQKQHVFLYPFYYIDYSLAQVSAFELYGRMKRDLGEAWADYLRLCEAGGSQGYFALLKLANLSNPFNPGSVQNAVEHVLAELDAP